MAGPVSHETNLRGITFTVTARSETVKNATNNVSEIEVAYVTSPAKQISFAGAAMGKCDHQSGNVIIDVNPIANILTRSINRDRLAGEGVPYYRWYEFLGMLPGPVIIGAIRHDDRQIVGSVPGSRKMIGGSFAGGIRGVGSVAAVEVEVANLCKRTENLVGRDMDEAKFPAIGVALAQPIFERRLEQYKRAMYVGIDKKSGLSIDRST